MNRYHHYPHYPHYPYYWYERHHYPYYYPYYYYPYHDIIYENQETIIDNEINDIKNILEVY